MKTTTPAQSPPFTCSDSSLSDAVTALNLTLKKHAEERTKELEIQLLKLEVTDLELQMITLARKLRAAKEKLIAAYQPESTTPQPEQIKVIRTKKGLRSKAVAEKLGISPSYYSEIEAGKKPVPDIAALAEILGCTPEMLSDQNSELNPQ